MYRLQLSQEQKEEFLFLEWETWRQHSDAPRPRLLSQD